MKYLNLFLLYIFLFTSNLLLGQSVAKEFHLPTDVIEGENYYVAKDQIVFENGFNSSSLNVSSLKGEIDPYLLFTPDTYVTTTIGNPVTESVTNQSGNASDEVGVVGSVPGSFSVSQSGSANYTVPISCPAGVNGMAPGISVSYNSAAGNGVVGLGASISGISMVSRVNKNEFYDDYNENIQWDSTDVFSIDGKRLFAINTYDDSIEYKAEGDPVSKIIAYDCNGDGPGWFKVWSNDGKIRIYGKSDNSKYLISKIDGTCNYYTWEVDIDPYYGYDNSRYIFNYSSNYTDKYYSGWYLEEIIDASGNSIRYTYSNEVTSVNRTNITTDNLFSDHNIYIDDHSIDNYHKYVYKWDKWYKTKNFLLDKITYTINSVTTNGIYQVKMNYENRFDTISSYSGGHEVTLDKRLESIDVKNIQTSNTLSTYSFEYTNDKYSKLINVGMSAGTSSFIPTTLDWGTASEMSIDVSELPLPGLPANRKKEFHFGDFNGDGKTDIFMTYADDNKLSSDCPHWKCYLNTSSAENIGYTLVDSGTFKDVDGQKLMIYDSDYDGIDEILKIGTYSIKQCYICETGEQVDESYCEPPVEDPYPLLQKSVAPPISDEYCQQTYSYNVFWEYNVTDNGLEASSSYPQWYCNGDYANQFKMNGHFSDGSSNDILEFDNNMNYQGTGNWPGFTDPDAMNVINFDGDGKQDIVQITGGVYCVVEKDESGTWKKIKSGTMLKEDYILPDIYKDAQELNFWDKTFQRVRYRYENDKLAKTDFNSDGITDFLINKNGEWKILLGTGSGYIEKATTGLGNTDVKQQHLAIFDFNNDGLQDIIKYQIDLGTPLYIYEDDQQYHTYRSAQRTLILFTNNGNNNFSEKNINLPSTTIKYNDDDYDADNNDIFDYATGRFTIGDLFDINGDGFPEVILNHATQDLGVEIISFNNIDNTSRIQSITKATGQELQIEYKSLAGFDADKVYEKTTNNKKISNFILQPGLKVVSKTSVTGLDYTKYFYKGLVCNRYGKGIVGFSEFDQFNYNSGLLSKTFFDYKYIPNTTYGDYVSMDNTKNEQWHVSNTSNFSFTSNNGILLTRDILQYDIKRYESDYIKMPYIKKSTTNDISKNISQIKEILTLNSVGLPTDVKTTVYNNSEEESSTEKKLVYTTKTYNNFEFYVLDSDKEIKRRPNETDYVRETSYTYYPNCLLKEKIDEPGTDNKRTESYIYDDFGNSISKSIKDSTNNITRTSTFNFSTDGRFLNSTENELGHTVQFEYDQTTGKVLKKIDANELETQFFYDDFGQLYKTIHPNKIIESEQKYWAFDNPEAPDEACYFSLKMASGTAPSITWFDMHGRDIRVDTKSFDGLDMYVTKRYNENNRPWQVTEPYYSTTDTTTVLSTRTYYDKYGRKTKTILPNGKYVETVYLDNIGQAEAKVYSRDNELIESTKKIYNASGDITESIDNLGNHVYFEYYSSGLLKRSWVLQDSSIPSDGSAPLAYLDSKNGSKVEMQYDIYGNRTQMDDPDAGIITSKYNAFGEIMESTNPNNFKTIYKYDALGRLYQTTVDSLGTPVKTTNWVFDTRYLGALTSVTCVDHLQTTTSTQNIYYDAIGRTTKTIEQFYPNGATAGSQTAEFNYTYDKLGRQSKVTYPNGFTIENRFNEFSDVRKVIRCDNGATVWEATGFNERGQLTNFKQGSNLNGTYGYSNIGEMTSQQIGSVFNMAYEFDDMGNLLHRTDNITNQKEIFGYDELNRLTTVTYSKNGTPNSNGDRIYKYDHFGNITDPQIGQEFSYNPGIRNTSSTTSGPHALDEITNVANVRTLRQPQKVKYNSDNKVTNIDQYIYLYSLQYGYDGQRRYSSLKSYGSNFREQFYFGLYEKLYDLNAGTVKEFCYIPTPMGTTAVYIKEETSGDANLYQIIGDYLGSVQVMVNNDNPADIHRFSFDAWGNTRSATDWTATGMNNDTDTNLALLNYRGFTGHEHILEFDLINMNGRVYDPLVKRFLSPDPYIQLPDFSQNYNRYSYCFNNPLKYTDPSGESIILAMMIGAFVNTFIQGATGNIDNGADFFKAISIGALSGAVAALGGGAAMSLMDGAGLWGTFANASIGMATSGFVEGAVVGAAAGFAGGFVGAAGNTWANGGSFGEGLAAGLKAGTTGAIVGGILGGISAGISAHKSGADFWTGDMPIPDNSIKPFIIENSENPEIIFSKNKFKPLLEEKYLTFDGDNLSLLEYYSDGKVYVENSWNAVSGANGNGELPNGTYTGTKLRVRTNLRMVRDDVGFSLNLNDAYDENLCRFRTLLRIHPDGHGRGFWWLNNGTNGCIGLQCNATQLNNFYNTLNTYLNRNEFINLVVQIP